jgi:hypothetical protein
MELKRRGLSAREIAATMDALKRAMADVGGCDGYEWVSSREPEKKTRERPLKRRRV